MGKAVTYKWVCDACDDVSPIKAGPHEPSGWRRFRLDASGFGEIEPLLCETCYRVLFQNRRKGPTWFNKLLRCFAQKDKNAKT